jgi:hypothetical protein
MRAIGGDLANGPSIHFSFVLWEKLFFVRFHVELKGRRR